MRIVLKVCITPRISPVPITSFSIWAEPTSSATTKRIISGEFTDGVSTLTAADTFAALETVVLHVTWNSLTQTCTLYVSRGCRG